MTGLSFVRDNLLSNQSQSQRQSHIATDDQSVSKSWCRTPSGAYDQIFITGNEQVFSQIPIACCNLLTVKLSKFWYHLNI
jgi:hypothetical protein